MEKYSIEKGRVPEPVATYQATCKQNKEEGYTVPPMPSAVREYYKMSNARQRFKRIATCKDRKNKRYDMEAYTEEIAFHIRQTHPHGSNSAIVFWKYAPQFYQQEQYAQQAYSIGELSTYRLWRLHELGRDVNLYISNADFLSRYSRQSQYVKAVSALMLDIDYYTIPHLAGLAPEEVYRQICNDVFTPLGLLPHYGISSGKGLYVVFLIETLDLKDKFHQQQLYRKLMERLIALTLPFGADPSCSDLSRVLRLPSTVNQKSGQRAYIIDFAEVSSRPIMRYSAADLAVTLGIDTSTAKPTSKPHLSPTRSLAAAHPSCTGAVGTLRTLGKARAADLAQWLGNRTYDIRGLRNTFFLLLASAALAYMCEDAAWEYIQAVNRQLVEPQPMGALAATFRSAATNYQRRTDGSIGYFSFTNEYIIEHLQITDAEMQHFVTIITKEEKHRRDYEHRKLLRRNEQGNTLRQQAKADKLVHIEALLAEGKTQTQVAKLLGVSRQLVSRYCKAVN